MPNVIDLLLLLLILVSVANGWRRGFVLGSLDLVRWAGSLLVGLRFYPYVAAWLRRHLDWNEIWVLPVSFLSVTILTSILVLHLGNLLLEKLPTDLHTRKPNQFLGMLPGLVSGLITTAIVAAILMAVPLPDSLERRVQASTLANRFVTYTDRLEMALAPVFEPAVSRTLNKLTVEPASDERIELPYKVAQARPRPDLEAQMLELVNQERAAEGLPPLVADTALRTVARQHSADMFRRGYFSHRSPEGVDAAQRVRTANIRYRAVGENLALAPTLPVAHQGLMDSPGHRANILQWRFGRVGIGVMEGGRRRLMITQNFRN